MRNFIQFIQYHNAIPIAVSVLLLGAGGVFAASNPSAVYSETKKVMSIDNTYIVQKDLSSYSPSIQIIGVTESVDEYFVAYTLNTVDVDDSVWKDVVKTDTMKVSKADLGQYRDLGVYVTDLFKNIVDRELQRLRETQANERTHVTSKVIATEYGGLIGKLLDTSTEALPGYTPVVQPPPSAEAHESIPPDLPGNPDLSTPAATQTGAPSQRGTNEPILEVLGNNPTEIPIGSTYNDLGAVITSTPSNYTIHVFFEGSEVQQVSLDTTKTGVYTITYKAWNQAGETGMVERTVRVIDPNVNVAAPEAPIDVPPPQEATTTP